MPPPSGPAPHRQTLYGKAGPLLSHQGKLATRPTLEVLAPAAQQRTGGCDGVGQPPARQVRAVSGQQGVQPVKSRLSKLFQPVNLAAWRAGRLTRGCQTGQPALWPREACTATAAQGEAKAVR